MAVWQFKMWAIPAAAYRKGNSDVIRLSREQVDEVHFDLTPADMTELSDQLSRLLPEKKSWHDEMRIWGQEETDDVQVWINGNAIESVQMRLDVRHLALSRLSGLCLIARNFDWLLAVPEGPGLAVLRPNTEVIFRSVLKSPAQSFVDDPEAFLAAIVRADSLLD